MAIKVARFPRSRAPREQAEWIRDVENRIIALETGGARNSQDNLNANKSQNSTMERQGRTIREMPYVATSFDSTTGFGLGSGWNTVASLSVTVPESKTLLDIVAIGGAAAVDMTSNGLTICQARIVIAGAASPTFSPAKDSGVTAVNNILTPNFGREALAVTPGASIAVTLQLSPLNPSAFPSSPGNYATLTAIAAFSGS